MSDLVGNPDCWFSHAKARILVDMTLDQPPIYFVTSLSRERYGEV